MTKRISDQLSPRKGKKEKNPSHKTYSLLFIWEHSWRGEREEISFDWDLEVPMQEDIVTNKTTKMSQCKQLAFNGSC